MRDVGGRGRVVGGVGSVGRVLGGDRGVTDTFFFLVLSIFHV